MAPSKRRRRAAKTAAAPVAGDGASIAAAPPPKSSPYTFFPPERLGLWPTQILDSMFAPYRLVSRRWRAEIPHMAAVFLAVLFLYGYTTPRLVSLEDDGLFIANLHFWGVAHPSGYPMHTFLGGIFYHLLPFGTPAFKGHLFSGFAGAVACAAIYAVVAMLARGRLFAYLGGLAYGASQTFWSQAIIAEVYTLNAMFFFVVLALCINYAGHRGRSGKSHNRLYCAIAFVYGLGLANHYSILGLGSIGLGMLVLSQWRNILPRIFSGLTFLALGAVPPYVWMIVRSQSDTVANFYGPLETVEQIIFYVFRKGYSGVDKQSGVDWGDKLLFSEQLGIDMLWQFTPLGFFFVVLGFVMMARSRYHWLWLSLFVSWFMSSVLLIFLLDFKAGFIWLAAFSVFHLLAYGLMAIWLALGAAWLVDKFSFASLLLRRNLGALIVLAVVGASLTVHWEANNRREYRWAHDLALAKINSVEPNAVLMLFDDLDLPVGYLHYVEGVRKDLTVFNDQGLVFGNRLYSPLIPDRAPAGHPNAINKYDILGRYIADIGRPVYYHPGRRDLYRFPRYGSDFTGFMRRVNRDNTQERVILSDLLRQWLGGNVGLEDKFTDRWTRVQHHSTVAQLIQAVLTASAHGFELDGQWREIIERASEKNLLVRLTLNSHRLATRQMNREDIEKELTRLATVDLRRHDLLDGPARGHFYGQRATLLRLVKGEDDPEYERFLRLGVDEYRQSDNPAAAQLLAFYVRKGRHCDYIALTEALYPDPGRLPKEALRQLRKARRESVCVPASNGEAA